MLPSVTKSPTRNTSNPIDVREHRDAIQMALLRVPFTLPAFQATTFHLNTLEEEKKRYGGYVIADTGYTNCIDSITTVADGAFAGQRVSTLALLQVHELLHIGLGHRTRMQATREHYQQIDGGWYESLLQIAADCEINQIAKSAFPVTVRDQMIEMPIDELIKGLTDQALNKRVPDPNSVTKEMYESKIEKARASNPQIVQMEADQKEPVSIWMDGRTGDERRSFEEIYKILHGLMFKQDSQSSNGPPQDGGGAGVEGAPQVSDGAKGKDQKGGEAENKGGSEQSRSSAVTRQTLEALNQHEERTKSQGTLGANILRQLQALAYPPTSALDQLTDIVATMIRDEEPSKKRFAKGALLNLSMIAPGVGDRPDMSIVQIIDTSGSVSQEDIADGVGDLKRVCQEFDVHDITIIYCDARVDSVQHFDSANDITEKTVQPTGGGGTSFVPPFEYIRDAVQRGEMDQPDAVLYVTDLMGSFPDQNLLDDVGAKVVWCLMQGAALNWRGWEEFKQNCPEHAAFVDYYEHHRQN